MKLNVYTLWMDPVFYAAAAVFAASLFSLIYSIRRYVELNNNSGEFDEVPTEPVSYAAGTESQDEERYEELMASPQPAVAPEAVAPAAAEAEPAVAVEAEPAVPAEAPVMAGEAPAAAPEMITQPEEPQPAEAGVHRAETFVKGIFEGLSSLDERLKSIESSVSKSRVNNDFAVKFLEDILSDLDALDKEKIKARIEYLLTDLKK